jgi:perosamine synthetase
MKVPVNEPLISDEAKAYVQEAMDTGWLSAAGPCVEKFEQVFADYIGVKHAIFVTSGTAALHLSLATLNLKTGDEVIVPDFTMIGSIFPIMYTGAKPIFIDVEKDTFNIDVAQLEAKITDKTKAIMPVHIYGHSCDMDPVMEIANKYDLAVIEDAAEVHGGTYKGKRCGSIGTINAFSFYGNKIITTGEGGMVCTDDDALALRARSLKDLAHSPEKRFLHTEVAFNYRATNLQAAVGLGQMENIEMFLERKRSMAQRYNSLLSDIKGVTLPVTKDYAENVYWMYALLVNDDLNMSRDELCIKLKEKGVDTRDFFLPCHSQPAVQNVYPNSETFPITEDIATRGFYLPSGIAITDDQIQYVSDVLHEITNA